MVGDLENADNGAEAGAVDGGAAHASGGEGAGGLEHVSELPALRGEGDGGRDFFASVEDEDPVADLEFGFAGVGEGVGGVERGRGVGPDLEVVLGVDAFFEDEGAFFVGEFELSAGSGSALVDGAGEVEVAFVLEVEVGAGEGEVVDGGVGGDAGLARCFPGAGGEEKEERKEDL